VILDLIGDCDSSCGTGAIIKISASKS